MEEAAEDAGEVGNIPDLGVEQERRRRGGRRRGGGGRQHVRGGEEESAARVRWRGGTRWRLGRGGEAVA